MLIHTLGTVACPEFCVCANKVYEMPKDIGKKLLALRDANGRPVAEVLTSSKKKPIPLKMNDTESEVWEAEGDE